MYYFIRVRSSSFAALRLYQLNIKYVELTENEQMTYMPLFKGGYSAVGQKHAVTATVS